MSRHRTNPLFIEKTCPTCSKRFQISFRKKNQIFCSRSCANHHPDTLEKIRLGQKKVHIEKYGGNHPMQTPETKEKFKASMRTKYGVEWYGAHGEHASKVKKTKKIRYGDENYNNTPKRIQTNVERYGVDNICKSDSIMKRRIESRRINHYEYLTTFCKNESLTPLFSVDEYHGYHFSFCYKFRCEKCGHLFESTVYNLDNLFCEKCDPDRKNTLENQFYDFLVDTVNDSSDVKRHDRTILYGKELDFLIASKKIAFELNGLYWHSEFSGGHTRKYHINKSNGCLFHGISLVHIFENEWRDKKEIIKSIIRTKLNYQEGIRKLHARKCTIDYIRIPEKDDFLEKNHLQGKDRSTVKLGLFLEKELVSLMTFRKTSRFDTTSEWEMVRFCNKINTIISGGASKLFSHFIKTYTPKTVVSYSDRRYFDGNLYSSLGFKFVLNTAPGYHYISKDYKYLMNRMQFQKHKLKNKLDGFDPTLSEWENMKNHGFDRIWDCGHGKWVFTHPCF